MLRELVGIRGDLKAQSAGSEGSEAKSARELASARRLLCEEEIARRKKARMLSRDEERIARKVSMRLGEMERMLRLEGTQDARHDFLLLKAAFDASEADRKAQIEAADRHLTNSFRFLSATFGEGQEIVLFLSELTAGYYSLQFVSECGNDAYYRYNRLLLLKDRRESLQHEAMELLAL